MKSSIRFLFVIATVVVALSVSFNTQLCLGQDPAPDPFGVGLPPAPSPAAQVLPESVDAPVTASSAISAPSPVTPGASLVDPSAPTVVPATVTNGAHNPYNLPVNVVFGKDVTELQVIADDGKSLRGVILEDTGVRNALWYVLKPEGTCSYDTDGDGVLDDTLPCTVVQEMTIVIFDFFPAGDLLVADVRNPDEDGRFVSVGKLIFKKRPFGVNGKSWMALIDPRVKAGPTSRKQAETIKEVGRRLYDDMRNGVMHPRVSTDGTSVGRVDFPEKALLEAFVLRFGTGINEVK